MRNFSRDLRDLLAALGIARPVLVGWSQGAQDVEAYVQQFGSSAAGGHERSLLLLLVIRQTDPLRQIDALLRAIGDLPRC
jgi:pimeloyl-ACP methyl ester carboxylesterase